MDATNLVSNIYKQEVANAIEQKVLFKAQLQIKQEELNQKYKEIEKLKTEINMLQDENVALKYQLDGLQEEEEAEVIEQCMEN